jgi:hypothetical protein
MAARLIQGVPPIHFYQIRSLDRSQLLRNNPNKCYQLQRR